MSSARYDTDSNLPLLTITGRQVPVVVCRHPQALGYRMRYDAVGGLLRLTIPARAGEEAAITWAYMQAEWIAGQIDRARAMVRLCPGASVPVENIERVILWDRAHPRRPRLLADSIQVGGPEELVGKRLISWLKSHALTVLREETLEIAARAGVQVSSVAVGDPRSRWGSCAPSGAIRYSWRLILAPSYVRCSTIAHEVAHRLHMDHSPAFHRVHARLLGADPAPARAWLRMHGAGLHRFTA